MIAKPVPAGVLNPYDVEVAIAFEMLRGRYTLRRRVDDRDWYANGSLFGINASSYKLWASGAIQFESDFAKLDEWDMQQEEVPVALYTRAGTIGRRFDNPIDMRPVDLNNGSRLTIAIDETSDFPSRFAPGAVGMVSLENTEDGDVLRIPPGSRVRSIDHARRTITIEAAPFEPIGIATPKPEQPRGKVPAHVHRHRARLDGRRMR